MDDTKITHQRDRQVGQLNGRHENKGSVIFYQEGGAPENWGDQVFFLDQKGGSKDYFKLKRGDHLYFLKK